MHTHISAVSFVTIGLQAVIFLTLWKLLAAHLAASSGIARQAGEVMAFQAA